MKVIIWPLVTFVIMCVFINCKKNNNQLSPSNTPTDIDSAVISRFYYLPGTYWIYRDSLTGRVDKFSVVSNQINQQIVPSGILYYYYTFICEANIDSTNPRDSSSWIYDIGGNQINMNYLYTYNSNGDTLNASIEYIRLFTYPFDTGVITYEYDTGAITNIYTNYEINGNLFDTAVEIHHHIALDSNYSAQMTKINDWFYINEKIGIIKIRIDRPSHGLKHIWELQSWNIVK